MNICPACQRGELVRFIDKEVIQHRGRRLVVAGVHFAHCPQCGEDVVLPDQFGRNEVTFAAARKAADLRALGA